MHILFGLLGLILVFVFRYYAEKAAKEAGEPLLSRSQLRYLRRKGRKTGKPLGEVPYKPRTRQQPIFFEDWMDKTSAPVAVPVPAAEEPPRKRRGLAVALIFFGAMGLLALIGRDRDPPVPQRAANSPASSAPAIVPAALAAAPPSIAILRAKTGANVRREPSGSGEVLRSVPSGTVLRVTEYRGQWARIAIGESAPIGWVYRPLLIE